MNNSVKQIVEGFFTREIPGRGNMPQIIEQKQMLCELLTHGEPINDAQWKYINEHMDGYVDPENADLDLGSNAPDQVLRKLCCRAIIAYGPAVSLNWIDVSGIGIMGGLFCRCPKFNGDISRWDVSNVTDMSEMFDGCSHFTGDISGWDTSRVRDMSYMFHGCKLFNCDISGWDVSNVTSMSHMFAGCKNFNRSLPSWNTCNVESMWGMFEGCEKFNGDISGWDVSRVNDMDFMFHKCKSFNRDLSGWHGFQASWRCMFDESGIQFQRSYWPT